MRMIITVVLLGVAGFLGWHTYQGTQNGLTPMAAAQDAAGKGVALVKTATSTVKGMIGNEEAAEDDNAAADEA